MTFPSEIITTIVSAITDFLTGIGAGIVDVFEHLLLTPEGGLTPFATYGLVFIGLSFAMGLFYALFRMIRK